ncbi:MAG: 23S rRNA (pseudouridine(1915)-N(3))-methyltransferase RlmH [Clostridiaceae bacterium]|jgi:23S rRNA (pseudouridine1915-N3)-methyltransferase|nr:23S rRNA (pseudouridine(1915)-N(3))-methyltransferase RlmH [Clostridiaceae bacterium]
MKFNIVAVGNIKENYLNDGICEYKKRISRFADLNIIECKEFPPVSDGTADTATALKNEAKAVLERLRGHVIALAIDGKELSSPELSEYISSKSVNGVSEFTFIIGGSDGLSGEVLSRADFLLSFGKATYPHRLMRLILCEQLYRAVAIINKLPYHK